MLFGVKVVRQNAIEFGISTPELACKMAGASDVAIVGSSIIILFLKHGNEAPLCVGEYVKLMKDAIFPQHSFFFAVSPDLYVFQSHRLR